jgi:hypothetical protein
VEIQLREYRIRDGQMDAWIAGWTDGVVPLRLEFGFEILGAWVDRQDDRFVWLIGYSGADGFRRGQRALLRVTETSGTSPRAF